MISKKFKPFNDVVMEPAYKHHTIKDMSEKERPREKLLESGAEALSVPELLAIIIGGGTTNKTAVGRCLIAVPLCLHPCQCSLKLHQYTIQIESERGDILVLLQ